MCQDCLESLQRRPVSEYRKTEATTLQLFYAYAEMTINSSLYCKFEISRTTTTCYLNPNSEKLLQLHYQIYLLPLYLTRSTFACCTRTQVQLTGKAIGGGISVTEKSQYQICAEEVKMRNSTNDKLNCNHCMIPFPDV